MRQAFLTTLLFYATTSPFVELLTTEKPLTSQEKKVQFNIKEGRDPSARKMVCPLDLAK
jgi:hypothetical protein